MAGAGLAVSILGLAALGDPRPRLGAFYGGYAAAFGCYVLALWAIGRAERDRPRGARAAAALAWIGIVAVAARLLLLPAPPALSDDLYRYRWDGRVQRAGIDPYAYAPADPRLAFLRDESFPSITFPTLRTVYPPLTQAAFRAGEALGGTLTAHKAVMALAEGLTVLAVLWLLWQRGRSLLWVAAYAWHPLAIVEVAGSGHNDALGVGLLWLGLAAWEARRRRSALAAWVAACWAKFASLLLVPWHWRQAGRPAAMAAYLALCALPFLLWPSAGSALVDSFTAMTGRVESNASLFALLAMVLTPAAARVAVFALGVAWIWWWAGRRPDPVRYLMGAIACAAFLSPALHPWYLLWLIPCFCFRRVPALVALSGTVVLAYTMWPGRLTAGMWELPWWARVAEYAPVAVLGVFPLFQRGQTPFKGSDPLRTTARLRVGVVIPARNEAEGLRHVLAELPREVADEVIVVDNGSTDATAAVAAAAGARVVDEPVPGYGRACLAGIAALPPAVDTVVFLDADHADDPQELPTLLEPIARGEADLVIGSRCARAERGSLTPQQRAGNALACALLRWGFGVRCTDLGPFRAIRRAALERLDMRDLTYGWTVEMQAKAAKAGLRMVEVAVGYRPRIGRSKISGTLKGAALAGITILATIVRIALEPAAPRRRLLIFLKDPEPGQVKTRLAASIGADEASRAYRACVETTLARLRPLRQEAVLYVEPPDAIGKVDAWLGDGWVLRPQRGRTLGERLARATAEAFADGAARVAVVGTDSPWIAPADIEDAFRALERADVAVGPAEDGGYYLIGLARPTPALFDGIAWSTPAVYAQTCARAAALGLRLAPLREGYDVDRVEDLDRFAAERREACLS